MAEQMTWNELLQDMNKELNIAYTKIKELKMKRKVIVTKKRNLQKKRNDFMLLVQKGLDNFLSSPFK
jgi:hypothetical protein|tara:strand:+ start:92 stop:292 length:201 start_codon:yes stop_codon:yes gene_type:complete